MLFDIIQRSKHRNTSFCRNGIIIKVGLAVDLGIKAKNPEGYISFSFLMLIYYFRYNR